jgi:hypothetical protein
MWLYIVSMRLQPAPAGSGGDLLTSRLPGSYIHISIYSTYEYTYLELPSVTVPFAKRDYQGGNCVVLRVSAGPCAPLRNLFLRGDLAVEALSYRVTRDLLGIAFADPS